MPRIPEYQVTEMAIPVGDCTLWDYHVAPGGIGPLHRQWDDKPHRLLYDLIRQIVVLRAQLKEWEKYTGFLYAHGFFRDANTPTAEATLTVTEDSPPV